MWNVNLINRARKNCRKMPKGAQEVFQLLLAELKIAGSIRNQWPKFGKIKGAKDCYHCHLIRGKPTYVSVWRVIDKIEKIIEVTYVGTHEKAEYDRLC